MKYRNEIISDLVYKSNTLEKNFWDKYYKEDSMANDLLDISLKIIKLKNKLIKEFEVEKEVVCECTNKGMNITGEYDIESNMYCPNCNEVVGDYELNELWYKYCPECGQKLKYTENEE